jgi:hypothetical protein
LPKIKGKNMQGNNQFFAVFGSGGSSSGGGGGVSGSGTLNYVAKWTPDGTTLGNSLIRDDGTTIGINVAPFSSSLVYIDNSTKSETLRLRNTFNDGYGINSQATGGGTNIFGGTFNATSNTSTNNIGIRASTQGTITGSNVAGSFATANTPYTITYLGNEYVGIHSQVATSSGKSVGGLFITDSSSADNIGVYIKSTNTSSSDAYGVFVNNSNTSSGDSLGIYIQNSVSSGNSYGIYDSNSNLNYLNGNTGIGQTPNDDIKLGISKTTSGSSATFGMWVENSSTNSNAGANGINYGMYINSENGGTGSAYGIYSRINNGDADGTNISVINNSTNTNTNLIGVSCLTAISGTITNLSDIYISSPSGAGIVTTYHGLKSLGMAITNCTNAYHIYLDGHTTGTNKYGIYQAGANDLNVFKGGLQVDNQIWSTQGSDISVSANASTFDGDNGNSQRLDLASATGDITLTFTNLKAGGTYFIPVIQKSSSPVNIGTYTISGGVVKFPSGTAPTISTGASAIDTLVVYYDGTDCLVNFSLNYS